MAEIRTNLTTGAPWEELVGYSRAVKVGNFIEVAGTTAVDQGNVVAVGDPYGQTCYIFQTIQKVLEEAGSSLADVVRTRIFVTNINDWEAVGKAHHEFFKDIKPATTLVEISKLIDKDLLVEIEVSAIISSLSV